MYLMIGLFIPFLGTAAGAACVFFLKKELGVWIQKGLPAFAAGVMMAASVWSLLIPAMEMIEIGGKSPQLFAKFVAMLPVVLGFAWGILGLLFLGRMVSRMACPCQMPKGQCTMEKRMPMLVLAVTLHNIPEGIAVGIAYAGVLQEEPHLALASAVALSAGIAIQNFPEGAIISLPLRSEGKSRKRAFFYGMLSGIVEPIAAVVTLLLTGVLTPLLPTLLAFAAGAMVYVVVGELLPEASEDGKEEIAVVGFAAGFLVMMVLDVLLG